MTNLPDEKVKTDTRSLLAHLECRIAQEMQRVRDEIGATEQQVIAFSYAEAAMRHVIGKELEKFP